MLGRRLLRAFVLVASIATSVPALANDPPLVTPGSPLSMTGLASFLNSAFQGLGGCFSGTGTPVASGSPIAGQCFDNTTGAPTSVPRQIYDGASWVTLWTRNNTAHSITLANSVMPLPGASALGAVFSSASVSNQFLTSINTDGTVSRAQPSAANLSNGTTGSGLVVLQTNPSLVAPALGAATGTTLALGGCTLGSNVICGTGTANFSSTVSGSAFRSGDGTAGAPAHTFTSDLTTGMQRTALGYLAFSVGGSNIGWFTPGGFSVNVGSAVVVNGSYYLNGNQLSMTAGTGVVTIPNVTDTVVMAALGQVLTNKTISAPAIAGGTHTGITSLGIRSTGTGAFDLTIANSENLTAGRTLTITTNDAARTLNMGGNITTAAAFTTSGAFALTLTATGATNITLPTTGTLATLAGVEALTGKTINGLTITSTTGTFTLASGKTLTVNNTMTLSGTDGTTMTFPSTSASIARTDAGQTFTGNQAVTGTLTVTAASAAAMTVGANGATNPALLVDSSTASSATGVSVKSAAPGGGVAVAAISSGTNENLAIDAKGSGTVTIGGVSTGAIIHTRATTLSAALTYGGVTLSNSVTGTGSMVLSAAPTITGHPTIEGVTSTGATGTGKFVFDGTPSITTPNIVTGFTIGGAAASGNYARGNGTNFVSSAIQAADLPLATNAAIGGMRGDGSTITCSAGVCTSLGGAASSIAAGSTTVTSGNQGYALTNNAGTLDNTMLVSAAGGYINKFRNAGFTVWQRGTTSLATSSGGLYTADGWIVAQAGAQGSCSRTTGNGGAKYALQCNGVASNTGTTISQRIESSTAAALASSVVTVQFRYAIIGTGVVATAPKVSTCYASATDNFGTCTSDLASTTLTSCSPNVWCIESYTFTASANATNGYQVTFDCNAALSAVQACLISAADIRATPGVSTGITVNPPPPELRAFSVEMADAQFYYTTSYGNGVAPGTAGATVMAGGSLAIVGTVQGGTYVPWNMRTTPSI